MLMKNSSFSFFKRSFPSLIFILFSALYLTFLVNLQTLETAMQRVFIFCYFVVMGVLACFLKSKYAEGKPFPLQSRLAAAVLAALLVGAGWNTFLPHVRFPQEGPHLYLLWEKIVYTLGAWAVVSYFVQLALLFLARPIERRGWTERQKGLSFLLMGNFVLLFFTSDKIAPTRFTQGFLLLLTVASVWCFNRKSACMEKYRAKGSRAAVLAIAVYASLASFAQRFFLNGNTRMHFSLPGLLYVLSGIVWFVPVVWLLLSALEWLSARPRTLPKPGHRKRALCILLAALLLCQVFVLMVEWPGGFPPDAIDQFHQAMGDYGLSDNHPFVCTLLEKIVLTVLPHPAALTAVQLLLFSFVLCAFLMMGYDRGVPLPLLAFLGCFFELMPNQVLSWTNVLKDFPFTLALLWGTYLLLQLALDTPRSRKWPFYIALALDIFLVSLLRHNGAAPAAAMVILCIVLTVRRYEQVKLRALTAALLAAVSFGAFKGPVMTALNVVPVSLSPFTTLFCAVGSCVNKDLPLSEGSNAILEKALPLEDWKDYYNRFAGHDYYYWGRPEGSVPYTPLDVTTDELFQVYGEALRKYPDVIAKDRIDGCDILWDVVQPEDAFNAKTFCFVHNIAEFSEYLDLNDFTDRSGELSDYRQTFFAKAYRRLADTPRNSALDILLWRTGAYLIAFWVLLLFWRKNGMQNFRIAAVPLIGNLIISVLYVYHQSFRYVYFVQVCVLALLFSTVVCRTSPEK